MVFGKPVFTFTPSATIPSVGLKEVSANCPPTLPKALVLDTISPPCLQSNKIDPFQFL